MPDSILFSKSEGIGTLTINRPEKANALSHDTREEMARTLDNIAGDSDVRALIITGSGNRVFCAGADLNEVKDQTQDARSAMAYNASWNNVTGKISSLPFLTIAAINGVCAGGGLNIALACDLRISIKNSKLFYPVLRNGILPPTEDMSRFIELIGPSRTKLLIMGGIALSTQEATEWGLITRAVPAEELQSTVTDILRHSVAKPQANVTAMKRMIDHINNPACILDCMEANYDNNPAARQRLLEEY